MNIFIFNNNTNIKDLYKTAQDYHTVYYESSRGCPFGCSYCLSGINNAGVAAKNADTVLRELEYIESKYYDCENSKINIIKFCDRTFNFDIDRANAIYKGIIARAGAYKKYKKRDNKKLLPYQFEIYPALFSEETFGILKTAPEDLLRFEIGMQSLNQKTLDETGRKNFDINAALKNISRIKSFGNIQVHVDLIAGLPFEDLKSFLSGFDLVYEKTKADFIQIGFLKLLRGTRIREQAELHGYIYEESPPYAVLQNKYMSFEDIALLRDTEKMYKRYFSKAFAKSLGYIYDTYFPGAASGILTLLAGHWRNNGLFDQPQSQRSASVAFLKAFEKAGIVNGSGRFCLIELLREDFYDHSGKILKLV
jgi:radical SAM superfamily enzyme YgiQ (UPF0313 family)